MTSIFRVGPRGVTLRRTGRLQSQMVFQPGKRHESLSQLDFGAMIAINLAVMNLLPVPALDGGRVFGLLVTTGIEAVTKKKIDPKYEGYIHAAGMILLLAFMAFIMLKDIWGLF